MPDIPEQHPLDDYEFEKAAPVNDSRTRAHKPLLRICVIVAAVAFGLVFIFSVLENNSPYKSTIQEVSAVIKNISAMIMLAGCGGILVAYRLPHIDPVQIRSGALAARGWFSNRYIVLALINAIPILMMWVSVFFLAGVFGVYFALPLAFLMFCLVGLTATMVFVHKGYLRGYAIGTLTVLVLLLNAGGGMFFMFVPSFRGGIGSGAGYTIGIAGMLTLAPLVGLVCAAYVALIEKLSRDSSS